MPDSQIVIEPVDGKKGREAFVDLGPLPQADAVELFARRVRAARGSVPTAAESERVGRIVRRLDGLPLALELAAAKTRSLTLAEIDEGLDDRFDLLAAGPRAADPRHQTLRALIDWSWETLTEPERSALLAIAVFPDGVGAADAAAVAAEFGSAPAAFDLLVDRSLLHRGDGRYRMLETVREYGLDRLRRAGQEPLARGRAAAALAGLATQHDTLLRGPRVRHALDWFDANDENLSAAGRWTREDPSLREVGLRLVRGCLWAWAMRERFDEVSVGVEHFADPDDPLESEPAVMVNGIDLGIHGMLGLAGEDDHPLDLVAVRERAERIAAAARRYPSDLASVLPAMLSAALARLSELAPARPGLVPLRPIDDDDDDTMTPWTRAFLALLRAVYAQNSGDVDLLGPQSERALAMFEEAGDVWGVALASQMRSEWLMLRGRLDEALAVVESATDQVVGLTSQWEQIEQRSTAIGLLVRLGRISDARAKLAELRVLALDEGSARSLIQYGFTAALIQLAVGDGAAALAELDVLHTDENRFDPHWTAMVQARRVQALVLCDRPDEARAALRICLPLAESMLAMAGWLARTDRPEPARRAFALAVRLRGQADRTDPTFQRLVRQLGEPDVEQAGTLEELRPLLD